MKNPFGDLIPEQPAANPFGDLIPPPVHDPNASPVEDWQTAATDPRVADAPVADFADQVGQGFFANYGDEIAAALGSLPNLVTGGRYGKDRQTILREFRERERKFEQEYPQAATVGELGGALGSAAITGTGAGLLGAAPGVLRSAGVGALMSGAQGGLEATGRLEGDHSFGDYVGTFGEGAALPAIAGGVLGGVAGGIGRLLTPRVAPEAQGLLDRGVDLTPGEIVGGLGKRMEDISTSAPFVGQMVRGRQADAVTSLNRAAWDEALHPIQGQGAGARMPLNTEMGHDAMAEAQHIFNRRYGTVVPRMTAHLDNPMRNDIYRIGNALPQDTHQPFVDAIRRHVTNNMENGQMTGRAIQDSLQGLRREARNLRRNPGHAYDVDLAQALDQTRDAIEASAGRYTPARTMGDFRRINEAYRNYVTLRDAGSRVSSEGGVFSPSSLHNAVRSADDTVGKGAFARGEAPMQGLSDPAKTVMTRRVNDSGTPERGAILTAIAAPWAVLPGVAASAPIAALYSQTGSRMFRDLARRSPHVKAAIRRAAARTGVSLGTEGEAMFGE